MALRASHLNSLLTLSCPKNKINFRWELATCGKFEPLCYIYFLCLFISYEWELFAIFIRQVRTFCCFWVFRWELFVVFLCVLSFLSLLFSCHLTKSCPTFLFFVLLPHFLFLLFFSFLLFSCSWCALWLALFVKIFSFYL